MTPLESADGIDSALVAGIVGLASPPQPVRAPFH